MTTLVRTCLTPHARRSRDRAEYHVPARGVTFWFSLGGQRCQGRLFKGMGAPPRDCLEISLISVYGSIFFYHSTLFLCRRVLARYVAVFFSEIARQKRGIIL